MSAKTKSTKAKTTLEAELNSNAVSPEFLDALIETSLLTLIRHLEKINEPEAAALGHAVNCLYAEQVNVLSGKHVSSIGEFGNSVAVASQMIVVLGGSFYTETGQIYPLKERTK